MSKKKGKTLANCNRKGGVGKTTSSASIAGAMVQLGFPVLMIDNDPQGDLSKTFLEQIPEETLTSTYCLDPGESRSDSGQWKPHGRRNEYGFCGGPGGVDEGLAAGERQV